MDFSDTVKKIFLAGVGAVAVTGEKSKHVIDELVSKGEITVEEGRELNQELKHKAEEKVKDHVTVNVTRNYSSAVDSVGHMTKEERDNLRSVLDQADADADKKDKAASENEDTKAGGEKKCCCDDTEKKADDPETENKTAEGEASS